MGEPREGRSGAVDAALTAADLPACILGDDGVVRAVSPALARLTGIAADAAAGRTLASLFDGWEPGGGEPPTLRRTRDDGEQVVEICATRLGGDTIVAMFDVSDHHETEDRLAELARFPEKNPGPVLWIDKDATILLANIAAKHVFGDDVVGTNWLDRCPGMTDAIWSRARTAAEPLVHDARLDAGCFAISHVPSDGGDFVFAFGADITARLDAEQRLTEVARFPDMNPGPVLRLDATGLVLLANRAARNLFGDDLAGRRWQEILPAGAARWDELARSAEPIPIETRIGGRDFQFTHRADPDTTLVFVFGADVTEQKRAEQGLRQSERMATLGTLAAGVAHELNNPAAAARRAADQLRDAFARLQDARFALDATEPGDAARARLRALDEEARARAPSVPATSTR